MIRRCFALSLLFLLGAAASPRAATAQELATARDAAVSKYVDALLATADWCQENKLYLFRDQCYQWILKIVPDQAAARAALKYERDPSGEWKQVRYRTPHNYDPDLEPEFEPRFQAIVTGLTTDLLAALKAAGEDREPEARKRAIEDILAVDPDNRPVRQMHGEDLMNGRWVLIETIHALKHRQELRDLAKEILGSIPDPKSTDPTDVEKGLGVTWQCALQGQLWRGLATTSEAELRRTVKTLDASTPLFAKIFGVGGGPGRREKGFYLLTGQSEAETCIKNHPAFDEKRRKFVLGLKAGWVPGRDYFFQWNDSPQVRLDGATRNALSLLILRSFDLTTKQGWAWEGLGLYLDYLLTGTRRTVYVSQEVFTTTEKGKKLDIDRRMKSPTADWVRLAREMLDAAVDPDLRTLLKRDVNEMNSEDLVYSYALVSYILEAYPEQATKFFVLQGAKRPLPDTVEAVFKRPYPEWKKRFERWLREVTD